MKKLLSFILALLLLSTLVSCTAITSLFKKDPPIPVEEPAPPDPNFPLALAGVDILEKPQRVACLTPSLVEQIYDLGLEDQLVGAAQFTTYPPEGAKLDTVGTALVPDIPEIIALGTQLVLSPTPLIQTDQELLDQEDILLLVLPPPQNLDDLWTTYESIALALEGSQEGKERGEAFTASLKGWFEGFIKETNAQESLSVAYFRQLPFVLVTGDSFEGQLLAQMGLDNIGEGGTDWLYPEEKASGEGLKDFQELDLLLFDETELTIKDFEGSTFYAGLSVTLEDRYILVSNAALEGRGLRMFQELLNLSEKSWPEATFTPLDFTSPPPTPLEPDPEQEPESESQDDPAPPREGSTSLTPDSSAVEEFIE